MVALAVCGFGCGGGDASSGGGGDTSAVQADTGGAPLSKAEFVKQGDAICNKVPERFGKLQQELEKEIGAKPSLAEIGEKAALPPLPEAAKELEELTPPKGDEQKAEAIVEALEAAAKGLEEKPTSELSGPKSPFAEFQKLTKEYGFQVCSQL